MRKHESFSRRLGDWIKGLTLYPGPLTAEVLANVLGRMRSHMAQSLLNGEYIDVWQCAERIHAASRQVATQENIIKEILQNLPRFSELSPNGKSAFVKTYMCLEQKYYTCSPTGVGQFEGQH